LAVRVLGVAKVDDARGAELFPSGARDMFVGPLLIWPFLRCTSDRRTAPPSRYKWIVNSPYLTIQEVAELARCEHRTVRRAIRSGDLKASLIGGRWIVRNTAVEEWFEACTSTRAQLPPDPQSRQPRKRERDSVAGRPGSVADLEAIRERMVGP
jgi:excisionase family DNA binding protein